MKRHAEFVTSAAGAGGFPRDRLPEVAMVGRSNVGKSSLINALVRQPLARTSAAPGKTRLANFYPRPARDRPPAFYPGRSARVTDTRAAATRRREEFRRLTEAYFDAARGIARCCCWSTRGTRGSSRTSRRGSGCGRSRARRESSEPRWTN